MKIPAPMIPPITAIVVPNNPSWRASPPRSTVRFSGFSGMVMNLDGGAHRRASFDAGRDWRVL
jgi:hypothetical protein